MSRMKQQRAISVVLCHVWFVNAYVLPPAVRIRSQRLFHAPSTLQRQSSQTISVLQRSDEVQQPKTTTTDRLWTYAYNIPKASHQNCASSKDRTRPVNSLVYFLKDEQNSLSRVDESMEEALERATIQAVRAASAAGDYRLIFRVVESAIAFADSHNATLLLPARLFGEAIESLSRTSCNVSKLKQMWKLSQTHSNLIQEPGMGAFELNTMIRSLASRGKIRAALDLYETETNIEGDTYTMSTLLTALTESISDDQSLAKDWNFGNKETSPCWQYAEGRFLLESCPRRQLNNHVFAAALRLNERAGQVFDSMNQRHYTAKSALDLLQLMKVCGNVVCQFCGSITTNPNASFCRNWKFHQM